MANGLQNIGQLLAGLPEGSLQSRLGRIGLGVGTLGLSELFRSQALQGQQEQALQLQQQQGVLSSFQNAQANLANPPQFLINEAEASQDPQGALGQLNRRLQGDVQRAATALQPEFAAKQALTPKKQQLPISSLGKKIFDARQFGFGGDDFEEKIIAKEFQGKQSKQSKAQIFFRGVNDPNIPEQFREQLTKNFLNANKGIESRAKSKFGENNLARANNSITQAQWETTNKAITSAFNKESSQVSELPPNFKAKYEAAIANGAPHEEAMALASGFVRKEKTETGQEIWRNIATGEPIQITAQNQGILASQDDLPLVEVEAGSGSIRRIAKIATGVESAVITGIQRLTSQVFNTKVDKERLNARKLLKQTQEDIIQVMFKRFRMTDILKKELLEIVKLSPDAFNSPNALDADIDSLEAWLIRKYNGAVRDSTDTTLPVKERNKQRGNAKAVQRILKNNFEFDVLTSGGTQESAAPTSTPDPNFMDFVNEELNRRAQ